TADVTNLLVPVFGRPGFSAVVDCLDPELDDSTLLGFELSTVGESELREVGGKLERQVGRPGVVLRAEERLATRVRHGGEVAALDTHPQAHLVDAEVVADEAVERKLSVSRKARLGFFGLGDQYTRRQIGVECESKGRRIGIPLAAYRGHVKLEAACLGRC